jgi:D-beta-D-heptose 7-phosphate kinase/D-beta-D-heptose 1-phosphate adenosyltransferase
MLTTFHRLVEQDRTCPRRIAVVGDAMLDEWITGTVSDCQESCPRLRSDGQDQLPGGAANAARQLSNWHADVWLIAAVPGNCHPVWAGVNTELCSRYGDIAVKRRYLDQHGRIVFRYDIEPDPTTNERACPRPADILQRLEDLRPAGVLLADYDKGFIGDETVRTVIEWCRQRSVPCVVDCKRPWQVYKSLPNGYDIWSVLQFNEAYDSYFACRESYEQREAPQPWVMTRGDLPPLLSKRLGARGGYRLVAQVPWSPVPCRNHVGAGDCFASHLLLGLVHGLSLEDAAAVAHAAGRVFVQYPLARPPCPHEIAKDLDPVGGKVLSSNDLATLQRSSVGRIVFTNGVFRLPHAGHTWLLQWARQRGDMLVVGINSDASARGARPGEFVLPLDERQAILAGLSSVDWIVPYDEDDPCALIRALKPDLLVKGNEYEGQAVPGSDLVPVVFAPPSPYPQHCTQLIEGLTA